MYEFIVLFLIHNMFTILIIGFDGWSCEMFKKLVNWLMQTGTLPIRKVAVSQPGL